MCCRSICNDHNILQVLVKYRNDQGSKYLVRTLLTLFPSVMKLFVFSGGWECLSKAMGCHSFVLSNFLLFHLTKIVKNKASIGHIWKLVQVYVHGPFKQPNLAFSLPKAHSITILD